MLVQIALLDVVFSLDSVITAVGMADEIMVMIIAVVIAVGVMMVFATPISDFVHHHPTVKMLALAFLILIGVTSWPRASDQHISKGYIYTAMASRSSSSSSTSARARRRSRRPWSCASRTPWDGAGRARARGHPAARRGIVPLTRPGA